MQVRKLTDDVSVAPQIALDDVAEIAASGFRSIVCHRPDAEAADQAPFDEVAAEARARGLEIRHQPVVSGQVASSDGDDFARLIEELPKPILAYCRTGTRCTALWCLAEAGKLPAAEIIQRAADAGYDMRPLMPAIEARSQD